jgi:ABC-type nitrate/sulfonate/bicarbonate transport system permease component
MMKRWINLGWPPLAVAILFLVIWQLLVSLFGTAAWLMPAPLAIFKEMIAEWAKHKLQVHLLATINLSLIGFGIGTLVGFLLACVLHIIPGFKTSVYPLLVLSQNIPTIVLAPLLMIWFGYGILPKIILIVIVVFFPVCVAILDGFMRTDRSCYNYMQMTGANRRQLFTKLELPSALPSLFSGLKISATYSVMGAVIAEWLGSDAGIGKYMLYNKSAYRTDHVFGAFMIIVALSFIFFITIVLLEKLLLKWHSDQR